MGIRLSPEDALLIHDCGTCRPLPSQRHRHFYFTSQFIGASNSPSGGLVKTVEWEQVATEVCPTTEMEAHCSGYDLGSSKTLTYVWRCFPWSTPPHDAWEGSRSWVGRAGLWQGAGSRLKSETTGSWVTKEMGIWNMKALKVWPSDPICFECCSWSLVVVWGWMSYVMSSI